MRRMLAALGVGLLLMTACGGDDGGVNAKDAGSDTTDTSANTDAAATTAPGTATTGVVTSAASAEPAATTTATSTGQASATTAKAGSATTAKAGSATTAKAGPVSTTATAPITFASFSVTATGPCPIPPGPDVSVTVTQTIPKIVVKWKLTGVIPDNVFTALDSVGGLYDSGLPTTYTETFTRDCYNGVANPHTYFVVAEVGGKQYVKSKRI